MVLNWQVRPADPVRAHALAQAAGVHPITAQLLLHRGVGTAHEAARFLQPSLQTLSDPLALPDMARAVARLREAIARREPILLFTDSDTDGLTAGAILYDTLRRFGAVVRAQQSNRIADGYGLPDALVDTLCHSSLPGLVILADCGTNQPEAIQRLQDFGLDTIVLDHHVPLDGWAHPLALINPFRGDAPGRELCSAGLAFKLAQALWEDTAGSPLRRAWQGPDPVTGCLDLAALGTLADCAPLLGESRILVAEGMSRLINTSRPGLRWLCEATETREPEPGQIVRRLVPRINASGRLGEPEPIWELLIGEDESVLERWKTAAAKAHETTKRLHRQIIGEAQEQVNRLHFRDHFVMVVCRKGWHQGLMGPLASQLTERYGRPTIAIALGEQMGVGSGRSVPMFNLLEALKTCQDVLVRFGGHAQACGLTVDVRNLERFRELVNRQAHQALGRQGLVPGKPVDLELPFEALEPGWVEELVRLQPFGYGNPRPSFVFRRVEIDVKSPRTAWLTNGSRRAAARGTFPAIVPGGRYDVVGSPAVEGEGTLTLSVSDVRVSTGLSAPARI